MTTWVLFVWYIGQAPVASWNYDTRDECLKDSRPYTRAVCVQVFVPRPKPPTK